MISGGQLNRRVLLESLWHNHCNSLTNGFNDPICESIKTTQFRFLRVLFTWFKFFSFLMKLMLKGWFWYWNFGIHGWLTQFSSCTMCYWKKHCFSNLTLDYKHTTLYEASESTHILCNIFDFSFSILLQFRWPIEP